MKSYNYKGSELNLKSLYDLPYMSKAKVTKILVFFSVKEGDDVTNILTKENALLTSERKTGFGYYLNGEILTLTEITKRVKITKSSVLSRIRMRNIEIESDVSSVFEDVLIRDEVKPTI